MVALSLLAITPVAAHAEWKSNNAGWWYTEGNSWATGWKNINGNWYYFYSDGYMAHDEWIGEYYLGSSGAWTTGSSSNTTSSGSQNNQSQTVYVSKQGIYHKSPTAHGMKYYTTMSRSEAESEGNRACKICY
jgi:FOG: Glucan-binding domain (YG repeat)